MDMDLLQSVILIRRGVKDAQNVMALVRLKCPLTNGDLFRNESDERNAQWLSKLVFHNCATTFECHECHPDDEGCAEEILKWLKKEAKDGCL